jgi:hypothetical protein
MLLAGCSSSGTIGSASSNAAGGVNGGATGGTGGAVGGAGTDAGCAQAMAAIQGAEKAQNSASPQTAFKGVNASIGELRAAAVTTKKPGGKDAMNKVADDLQNVVTLAEQGQTPDTQGALKDAQIVAGICGF